MISTNDTGVIGSLAEALNNLSSAQKQALSSCSMKLKDISEAEIIEVDNE